MPLTNGASPAETEPSVEPTAGPPGLRVLLVDDHAVVRAGLRTLVEAEPGMRVVGEAGEGRGAVSLIRDLIAQGRGPDVVLMDVSMPGGGGGETTARIKEEWPDIRVLVLTMHEDRSYLRGLLEAGAAGYVLKRSAADELIRAIRAVASGGTYLDPALSAAVVDSFVGRRGASPAGGAAILAGALSEREGEVLRLIARGFANKEIAARLAVSVKTVETYKARSMEKLGLDSRADIVRYALAQGWFEDASALEPPPPLDRRPWP
jgi:DNA-binding NarL/FixJ family response regulator